MSDAMQVAQQRRAGYQKAIAQKESEIAELRELMEDLDNFLEFGQSLLGKDPAASIAQPQPARPAAPNQPKPQEQAAPQARPEKAEGQKANPEDEWGDDEQPKDSIARVLASRAG
jgi:hypothetical protein